MQRKEVCFIPALMNLKWKWEVSMRLIVLDVEVGKPANPDVTEKVEFLIDSGAIYSVVPSQIAVMQ